MTNILDNYTPEQIEIIKEAVFKISDAYQMLKNVSDVMAAKRQWQGHGDIAYIASVIRKRLTGDEGCVNQFLKIL